MNKTIEETIRCMLYDAKLPKSFWVKAMHIIADFINLSPSTSLHGDVLK